MHKVLSKDVSEVETYRHLGAFDQLLTTLETLKDPSMRLKIVSSQRGLSLQAEKKPTRWYGRLFEMLFGKSKTRQGKYVHAVIAHLLQQNKHWLKKQPVSDLVKIENAWLYIKAKFSYLKSVENPITAKKEPPELCISDVLKELIEKSAKSAERAGRQEARLQLAEEANLVIQNLSALKRTQQAADELFKTKAKTEQLEQETAIVCQEIVALQEIEREKEQEIASLCKEAVQIEKAVKETASERHALQLQYARFGKRLKKSVNLNRAHLQKLHEMARQADVANKEPAAQFARFIARNPQSFDISLLARDGSVPSNSYFLSQIPHFKKWLENNPGAEISLSDYSLTVVRALNDYCLGKAKAQFLNIKELKELLDCATFLEYLELQEAIKALLANPLSFIDL
ncbi:MAG: hypothetical protein K0S07_1746 [Chlamydiales bacterium]|jgi:hypothetical protein|nr:hypothetical protein [Chlamydiales bacterium]